MAASAFAAFRHASHRLPAIALVGTSGALGAVHFRRQHVFMSTVPDVLVIGGTGLMGAPTARLLQSLGHRVVIMSRGSGNGQGVGGHRPDQPECEILACDREDTAALLRTLDCEQCPRVIVDFTAMQPDHIQDIVAAHKQRSLKHYIFISTNMVYPGGVEDMDITALPQPVPEEAADLAAADAAPDTYGGKKLKCEALLQRASEEQGLPFTTLRPPAVVGPGCDDRHERLQRLVADLPPLPGHTSTRPPTANPGLFRVANCSDVAEAVAAVVALADQVHSETFNVAGSESVTLHEYVAAIGTHIGREPAEVPDDPSIRNFERQGQIDVSKAQRILGFQGTPMAEWMGETVAWHARLLG